MSELPETQNWLQHGAVELPANGPNLVRNLMSFVNMGSEPPTSAT
jgi:hypothetical protein